jgi:hypothetical protein
VVGRPPAGWLVVGEFVRFLLGELVVGESVGFDEGLAVGVAVGVSVGVAVGLAAIPMERSLSTGLSPLNARTKDTRT